MNKKEIEKLFQLKEQFEQQLCKVINVEEIGFESIKLSMESIEVDYTKFPEFEHHQITIINSDFIKQVEALAKSNMFRKYGI